MSRLRAETITEIEESLFETSAGDETPTRSRPGA